MHRLGDGHDIALEQAAGVRIGEHDRGDIRGKMLAHFGRVDGPVPTHRDGFDAIAEQGGGRRIGAVRGIRNEHDRALVAARGERGLDRHHAAHLAVRSGFRRERDRRHAGHFQKPARQFRDQVDRAGQCRKRLQRMNVADARQPRHCLVQARIVLHRAGPERKHAGVDAVILLREPHVMAHRFRLAQAGKADGRFALQPAETRHNVRGVLEVDAARVDAADFEDQVFLDRQSAIAGEGGMLRRVRRAGVGRPVLPVHHSTSVFPSPRFGGERVASDNVASRVRGRSSRPVIRRPCTARPSRGEVKNEAFMTAPPSAPRHKRRDPHRCSPRSMRRRSDRSIRPAARAG